MFHATKYILLFFVGFTIPMESMGTFHVAGYPVGPNKIATGLLLIFAFLAWPITGRGIPWNRKHPWVILFAVAVVAGTLSSLLRGGLPLFTVGTVWSSYAAVLTFSFLLPLSVTAPRDLRVFLGGLVLGAVAAVAGGLAGAEHLQGEERFVGTEGNPNELAGGLVVALPVIFGFFFASRSLVRKSVMLGGAGLALMGIIVSLSRAGFLSLVVMGGLWVLRFRSLKTLGYLLPLAVLSAGVLALAPQAFFERVETIHPEQATEDSSVQKRLLMDYWAARALLEHPFLGVGVRQAGTFANAHDRRIGRGHSVHHAFLEVGAELGLAGLIPMLMFIGLTWLDYSQVRGVARFPALRADPELQQLAWWATFLQLSFAGAMVMAQFHPTTRDKTLWMLIGLSSALVAMARSRIQMLQERPTEADRELSQAQVPPRWTPWPASHGEPKSTCAAPSQS